MSTDWLVTGTDLDPAITEAAIERGVIVDSELREETSLVIVATPASVVAEIASKILADHDNAAMIVTDVAGVKEAIVDDVADPRFLAGHPMAGSELRGLAGARGDLFQGCTWVLTPTPTHKARDVQRRCTASCASWARTSWPSMRITTTDWWPSRAMCPTCSPER